MSPANIFACPPVQVQALGVRTLPREEIVMTVKVCVFCPYKNFLFVLNVSQYVIAMNAHKINYYILYLKKAKKWSNH